MMVLIFTLFIVGCSKQVGITIDAEYEFWISDVRIDNQIIGDIVPVDIVIETGTYRVSWVDTYYRETTHSGVIDVKKNGEVFIIDKDNKIRKK